MTTLSSSAREAGIQINYRGIIDRDVDPGVPGGRELVALGHSAALARPEPSVVKRLADAIGAGPAVTAAEIAGAFAMINRVMDATGSHVDRRRVDIARAELEQLGAMDFHKSTLVRERKKKPGRKLRGIVRRLGR